MLWKSFKELPVTDDNYDVAIRLLKENFEDEEANLQKSVNKLIDLEGPKHTHQELTSFRINMSGLLKSISIHKDIENPGWLINQLIQKKLSMKTCNESYHRYQKNYFSYTEVEEGLLELCKHLDSIKKGKDAKESKVKVASKVKPTSPKRYVSKTSKPA